MYVDYRRCVDHSSNMANTMMSFPFSVVYSCGRTSRCSGTVVLDQYSQLVVYASKVQRQMLMSETLPKHGIETE